ncbi:MAG: deoxyribonuclease IV [Halanaerobiales bacterium]|nr:deoxyribonuclease IV [Halanaerobiales bacterium]
MKLGRHLSISGGIDKAVKDTQKINANSLQIFTKSPRSWKQKTISDSEIESTKNNINKFDIKGFVVHSSYLVNLATPKKDLYNKSLEEIINDYKQANLLGANYYVFHPGNYVSSTKDEGIKRIIKGITNIFKEVKNPKTKLLIENTAGAGTEIGSKISELAEILNGINNFDHLGVCLDLCHLFAAGYKINSKKGIDDLIEEVDNKIGLNNLKLIHLNDSKFEIDTKKDRHEHIGQGKIGIENFKYIVNHKKLANKLFIIETPPFDGEDKDIQTILKLKGE